MLLTLRCWIWRSTPFAPPLARCRCSRQSELFTKHAALFPFLTLAALSLSLRTDDEDEKKEGKEGETAAAPAAAASPAGKPAAASPATGGKPAAGAAAAPAKKGPVVLADGTYAQSASIAPKEGPRSLCCQVSVGFGAHFRLILQRKSRSSRASRPREAPRCAVRPIVHGHRALTAT